MRTGTVTLLSIAGVLAAGSAAAIVNAQVLDTDDGSRPQVTVPVSTLAPSSSTVTTIVGDDGADDANDTTTASTTAVGDTVPVVSVEVDPAVPASVAPVPTTAAGAPIVSSSGQPRTSVPATTAPRTPTPTVGTTPSGGTVDDDHDEVEDHGGDRSGDDD